MMTSEACSNLSKERWIFSILCSVTLPEYLKYSEKKAQGDSTTYVVLSEEVVSLDGRHPANTAF